MDDDELEGYSMKKRQQAKILEMLETLKEAHEELHKQVVSSAIISLLANCQEFALHIGRYIESIKGEGTNTVVLLEEYCEIAYKASLKADAKLQVKRLQRQLVKIKNRVVSELRPDKIEIAFFPYQLSMFDSFESVYLEAKADPNCDVYVVPVPWFDRLPNGEMGKMYYDGNRYPKHIPITNWKEYDVESRHPDIIYIHNPYDNNNYVTSIHPDFYSQRLRFCTDLLVYIPYFVCGDVVPTHFCTTAACIYAHKIILQSDRVRNAYIGEFEKTFGNRFGNPKDKFVALGSPKFDAVVVDKTEKFVFSKRLEKIIFSSEGTKKRVVMFNTSVGSILQGNEQYLEKIRQVIRVFKNRDDVVLWWRPHPLSEVTYQSMRPQLLSEYRKIIEEYSQNALMCIE